MSKITDLTNLSIINPFTVIINIEQSSIDVDHRIILPWQVGTFNFGVGTYTSDGYSIDSGSFTFSTVKR